MWVTFTLTRTAPAPYRCWACSRTSVATGTLASATDDDAGDSVSRLTFNMKLSAGTCYTAVMGCRAHWSGTSTAAAMPAGTTA